MRWVQVLLLNASVAPAPPAPGAPLQASEVEVPTTNLLPPFGQFGSPDASVVIATDAPGGPAGPVAPVGPVSPPRPLQA
jgi:hypothetical protein